MQLTPIVNHVVNFILSIVYAVLGMILLYVGYKVFDMVTRQTCRKRFLKKTMSPSPSRSARSSSAWRL